ncbi:MAG: GC-type dockerin domain-anchored protein, partial [Phycisphaerae bacterium]
FGRDGVSGRAEAFLWVRSPSCPGDLNGDGVVELIDLAVLLSVFGSGDSGGDLDGDGDTDLSDLAFLLGAFGTVCS